MNFCDTHWTQLRHAIDNQGMKNLVVENPEQALDNIFNELNNGKIIADFDPLISAAMCISTLSMHIGGLGMMLPDNEGKMPCPVCFMQNFDYIAAAAEGSRLTAEAKGLM